MKKLSLVLLSLFVTSSLFYTGCDSFDDPINQDGSILPERFSVDIPSSISSANNKKSGRYIDTLQGNEIYEHLTFFIHVGESAAQIVEHIILAINIYEINKPMNLSYEGDDDGRVKNLSVVKDVSYDGEDFEFQLTITDADSEGNDDGGNAMQVFWNNNPTKGIALLKPYNIDRVHDAELGEAIFRIDYSEGGEYNYDAHMLVSITGLPMAGPLDDPYSMKAMKMFVGKEDDIVDVYGNSDHPNAIFFAGNTGFNWAFVASGKENTDIGCAEVGLPPSNLDEPSRNKLLEYYSIKSVFSREIHEVWPGISDELVNAYLANTDAPGYFDTFGFVSAGVSPGNEYDVIEERLDDLSPYNPKEIANMSITFKSN